MPHDSKQLCATDGCDKPRRAKSLCSTHYNQTYYPDRHHKVLIACAQCGVKTLKEPNASRPVRFCSYECRDVWLKHASKGCHKPDRAKPPLKGRRLARQQRSNLVSAIERGDNTAVLIAIKAKATMTEGGCWEWPALDSSGYPIFGWSHNGKQSRLSVHRVSLEAKMDAPLGMQPAHHKCANRACVNPEHLQPVTHAENIAEMMARTYMTRRIAALESALRKFDPSHELICEIGLPA